MKYLQALAAFVSQEPAMVVGVAVAALNLLAGYGLPVGGQHALDAKALIETIVILIGALVVRSKVSPVAPAAPAAPAAK